MFFRKTRTLYNRVSISGKPEHTRDFLFLSLSLFSLSRTPFSLLSLLFFLPSLLSLFLLRPATRSGSGAHPGAAQRARDPGRPDPASPGQIRPSPGQIRPSPGHQLRPTSRTARTRALSRAATSFRRRFPRVHPSTCSPCRCRHVQAFGKRFRGP